MDLDFDASGRCALCRYLSVPFESLRFLWDYQDAAKSLISVLKYRPSYKLARLCADSLVDEYFDYISGRNFDLICSIPSSPQSIARRGFCPAHILANSIASALKASGVLVPYLPTIFTRTDARIPAQASLKIKDRVLNVLSSIRLSAEVSGARVLLIDDVLTSGATVFNASITLLQGGASGVSVLTLARSLNFVRNRAMIQNKLTRLVVND